MYLSHLENGDQPFKGIHSDMVTAWAMLAAVLTMRLGGERRREPRKSRGGMETHSEDCGRCTGLSLRERESGSSVVVIVFFSC